MVLTCAEERPSDFAGASLVTTPSVADGAGASCCGFTGARSVALVAGRSAELSGKGVDERCGATLSSAGDLAPACSILCNSSPESVMLFWVIGGGVCASMPSGTAAFKAPSSITTASCAGVLLPVAWTCLSSSGVAFSVLPKFNHHAPNSARIINRQIRTIPVLPRFLWGVVAEELGADIECGLAISDPVYLTISPTLPCSKASACGSCDS